MPFETPSLRPLIFAVLLLGCGDASERAAARSDSARATASTNAVPAATFPTDSASSQSPTGAADSAISVGTSSQPRSGSASTPDAVRASRTPAAPRRVLLGSSDLTGIGYDVGSPDAPVVVIDFSDFGCPYCARFSLETYPSLEREYVRTGKVLFKYVPFVIGMFPQGNEAARAAECAGDQGRFWPMHDLLYVHQREWKGASEPAVAFGSYADSLGLDHARFGACYARGTHPHTRRANEIARDVGVRVTPSFVVNGRPVEGALPLADFRRVLDAALLLERTR